MGPLAPFGPTNPGCPGGPKGPGDPTGPTAPVFPCCPGSPGCPELSLKCYTIYISIYFIKFSFNIQLNVNETDVLNTSLSLLSLRS